MIMKKFDWEIKRRRKIVILKIIVFSSQRGFFISMSWKDSFQPNETSQTCKKGRIIIFWPFYWIGLNCVANLSATARDQVRKTFRTKSTNFLHDRKYKFWTRNCLETSRFVKPCSNTEVPFNTFRLVNFINILRTNFSYERHFGSFF